jgi:hypothetical protein
MLIFPAACLFIMCASTAWLVLSLRDRRPAMVVPALLCGTYAAFVSWRLLNAWADIAIGLLVLVALIGLAVGFSARSIPQSSARSGLVLTMTIVFTFPFTALATLLWRMSMPLTESRAASPDGVYVASLCSYTDGDEDWQVASVNDTAWRPYPSRPNEIGFAFRGMKRVWWKTDRTLVVDFDGGEKPKTAGSIVERQVTTWRDVVIVYRDVHRPREK